MSEDTAGSAGPATFLLRNEQPEPLGYRAVRIAAVDVGSNSFHLLVAEAQSAGGFVTLSTDKETLRLGESVAATGRISDELAGLSVEVMRRFKATCESLEVTDVVAYGTAALREAENSSEVIAAIGDGSGIHVEVISGRDEARLIFKAIRASLVIDPAPALCLDLGGGSLELNVGDHSGQMWSDSLRLGVGRLTTEFMTSDAPYKCVRRMRKRIQAELTPVIENISALAPKMLIGTSGTLTALVRMAALRSGADPEGLSLHVNQLRIERKWFDSLHRQLAESAAEERLKLPGLDAKRVHQIVAGSTTLQVVFDLFNLDSLTVGTWAMREGMLLDAIDKLDPIEWSSDPRAIRGASVRGLARRCRVNSTHARQVSKLAGELFDQTSELHGLGAEDRELLTHGGVLHDIGELVSVEGHHKHSAYLVQHGKLRGFTPTEVNILASMCRFHRGSPKMSFAPYAGLSSSERARTDKITALLQLADGLDRGHAGVITSIDVDLDDKYRMADITAIANGAAELEAWGGRRKAALFESVFGYRVRVRVVELHGTDARAPIVHRHRAPKTKL